MEINICPILMRTVRFEKGICTEECREDDCPVMALIKDEEKE